MAAQDLPAQVPTPNTNPDPTELIYLVADPYGSPSDDAATIADVVTAGGGGVGPTGPTGPAGACGVSGTTGACGVSGVAGACGVSGVSGVAGACGVSGVAGACGVSGVAGTNGACGVSGVAGACGVSGVAGACGVSGVSGVAGACGVSGVSGITGDIYLTTSTTSNAISIPTTSLTFTVAAGLAYTPVQSIIIVADTNDYMTATVTSYSGTTLVCTVNTSFGSGTYTSWTINLDGATGGQGACGVSGVSGVAGACGVSGVAGTAGACGVSGVAGTNGACGVSGVAGACGVSGVAGACGVSGVAGACGVSGVAGACGVSGISGPNNITTATTTNLTGVLEGNGSNVLAVDYIPGQILATQVYAPGTTGSTYVTYTLGATTLAALDTTNATLAFTVPASGIVDIEIICLAQCTRTSSGNTINIGILNHSGGAQLGPTMELINNQVSNTTVIQAGTLKFHLTGLTPGAFQVDLAAAHYTGTGNTGFIYAGASGTLIPCALFMQAVASA